MPDPKLPPCAKCGGNLVILSSKPSEEFRSGGQPLPMVSLKVQCEKCGKKSSRLRCTAWLA